MLPFVPETMIFDTPFLFSGYDQDTVESVLTDSTFRDLYNQANEAGGLVCLMLSMSFIWRFKMALSMPKIII